eukprot:TRINITY_DN7587_c0_g1_i1.p1 TRINITY_DN7587_c0_g1~~TRINITY_DN7587_c0_g1_i1.p1  ORF type:complete len:607 (+),score=35.65 TRINITY_DN7587_c0_g1_i1:98-1918(+)
MLEDTVAELFPVVPSGGAGGECSRPPREPQSTPPANAATAAPTLLQVPAALTPSPPLAGSPSGVADLTPSQPSAGAFAGVPRPAGRSHGLVASTGDLRKALLLSQQGVSLQDITLPATPSVTGSHRDKNSSEQCTLTLSNTSEEDARGSLQHSAAGRCALAGCARSGRDLRSPIGSLDEVSLPTAPSMGSLIRRPTESHPVSEGAATLSPGMRAHSQHPGLSASLSFSMPLTSSPVGDNSTVPTPGPITPMPPTSGASRRPRSLSDCVLHGRGSHPLRHHSDRGCPRVPSVPRLGPQRPGHRSSTDSPADCMDAPVAPRLSFHAPPGLDEDLPQLAELCPGSLEQCSPQGSLGPLSSLPPLAGSDAGQSPRSPAREFSEVQWGAVTALLPLRPMLALLYDDPPAPTPLSADVVPAPAAAPNSSPVSSHSSLLQDEENRPAAFSGPWSTPLQAGGHGAPVGIQISLLTVCSGSPLNPMTIGGSRTGSTPTGAAAVMSPVPRRPSTSSSRGQAFALLTVPGGGLRQSSPLASSRTAGLSSSSRAFSPLHASPRVHASPGQGAPCASDPINRPPITPLPGRSATATDATVTSGSVECRSFTGRSANGGS